MSSREDEAAVLASLLDPNLETQAEILRLIPGATFFTDPQMGAVWDILRDLPPSPDRQPFGGPL